MLETADKSKLSKINVLSSEHRKYLYFDFGSSTEIEITLDDVCNIYYYDHHLLYNACMCQCQRQHFLIAQFNKHNNWHGPSLDTTAVQYKGDSNENPKYFFYTEDSIIHKEVCNVSIGSVIFGNCKLLIYFRTWLYWTLNQASECTWVLSLNTTLILVLRARGFFNSDVKIALWVLRNTKLNRDVQIYEIWV